MFRIVFIALGGEEQVVFVAAESKAAAIKLVAARDDVDVVLTCTQLDTFMDWAGRLGLTRRAVYL